MHENCLPIKGDSKCTIFQRNLENKCLICEQINHMSDSYEINENNKIAGFISRLEILEQALNNEDASIKLLSYWWKICRKNLGFKKKGRRAELK
ncbi:hypothetical protein NPIL_555421 [Nephila pilipes]|uniref:Uncharacterized protein n=1 Tax=Nephila pilipes TaxID=299642 RepID=A0A8X6TWJ3_NEPPI|nr:hypothetical protein NPIL_555421 [Nephila pilipes]